jgi:hypothetical protein
MLISFLHQAGPRSSNVINYFPGVEFGPVWFPSRFQQGSRGPSDESRLTDLFCALAPDALNFPFLWFSLNMHGLVQNECGSGIRQFTFDNEARFFSVLKTKVVRCDQLGSVR